MATMLDKASARSRRSGVTPSESATTVTGSVAAMP